MLDDETTEELLDEEDDFSENEEDETDIEEDDESLDDELRQVMVADIVLRQEPHVKNFILQRAALDFVALGIHFAALGFFGVFVIHHQIGLTADQWFDIGGLGLFVKIDRAKHVAVVGQRQRFHPQASRIL